MITLTHRTGHRYDGETPAEYKKRLNLHQSPSPLKASDFKKLTTNQSRQDTVWAYLKNTLKIDKMHVAAIMGNMSVETGGTFSSSTVQGSRKNYSFNTKDGVGYGLLQWSYPSRKAGLHDFAKRNNGNLNDYDIQLKYIIYEGAHEYKSAYSNFFSITDLVKATSYFCTDFEKAGKPHMNRRTSEAKRIFKKQYLK